MGQGERALQEATAAIAARHSGRIALEVAFDEDLAHAIEAGADLFLMPSRYEPCGLNPMYSQRYGTPPVARLLEIPCQYLKNLVHQPVLLSMLILRNVDRLSNLDTNDRPGVDL